MNNTSDLSVPSVQTWVSGVLEQGCEFEGKLCFRGNLRINGQFKGEIFTPDVLVIGEEGKIFGKIEAGVVIINGEFTGEIHAKYRVEIQRPAVFKGQIYTPSLSVQEGVVFEGSNKMLRT